MEPKNVIMWTLLSVIIVLLMTTCVQAQELTEVPASIILQQIENGEDIYYENVRITGEVDLSEIELKTVNFPIKQQISLFSLIESKGHAKGELKIVESEIVIRNSVFENDVDFSYTLLKKPLGFLGTSFSGKTNFRYANFSDAVGFTLSDFGDGADFSCASFSGDAAFVFVDFSGVADFRYANFSGLAYFFGAVFSGEAYFMDANFSDFANFGDAVFSDDADFRGAYFSGSTYIDDAYFGGDADFSDAYFSSNAIFRSTEFNKVYFTGASFTTVSLNKSNFNSMNVEWSTLKDALVFDGPTYMKLIKNFREMEQFDDADAAYYQYRRLSQANKRVSVSKLGDVFMWVTCGYGVKPHYTIGLGVVIILVFSLIYWRGSGIRRLKEIEGEDNRVSFWDAFYFSMVTFTTVGYGDWYPVDRYRKFVMIEGLVGWLTLALFLVTLANVMIRP